MNLPKLNVIQEKNKLVVTEVLIKFGFPVRQGLAQICAESLFNDNAVSSAGAKGICQFMDATYSDVKMKLRDKGYNIGEVWDVKSSVIAYVYYMGVELPRILHSNGRKISWENLFRSYNAGPGNLERSYSIKETNDYVKRIKNYMKV